MTGSFKFKPAERLGLDLEIRELLRNGRREADEWLVLYSAEPSKKEPDSGSFSQRRLAIRVPRKLGDAVRRNRAKRILREIFRREKWNIRERTDLLVVVKSFPAGKKALLEVRSRFIGLCIKSGIWQKP